MKTLKFLTAILCLSLFTFTSCQDEIDNESGDRTDTNAASSPTANNLERSSQYDGSFDDFLDGSSCSSILLPVVATINNTKITILTQSDYNLVLNILGELTNDSDQITFQFPISVRLSNYTEVQIANQTEYNALMDACQNAEEEGQDAINCLDIDFPITLLTYSLNLDQTGSVVIESEQALYTYMNNFGDDELFSVNYPITATLNNNTAVEITSDADLNTEISECTGVEDDMADAEEDAETLETILAEGAFKIESFVSAGANTANDYANYSIDFANDLSITATHIVNTSINNVEGTYAVTSEVDVFLSLSFSGNTSFELLNNTWKVTNFSNNSIKLQSSTNTAITLILKKV